MRTKNKIILSMIIVLIIVIMAVYIIFFMRKSTKNSVSYARASKMLSMLETDKASIGMMNQGSGEWYNKYINYMVLRGYFTNSGKKPDEALTYGELNNYLKEKNIDTDALQNAVETDIKSHRNSEAVDDGVFKNIYEYLVVIYGSQEGVHTEELLIAGTPDTVPGSGKWQVYTDRGSYGFEGLNIEQYRDSKIKAYVRNNEILSISMKISDDIVYRNVYIEKGNRNTLTAYICGVSRTLNVSTLAYDFENQLGDISMNKGKVMSVSLKGDIIEGKVLMIDDSKVEIEGYGTLYLDKDFHVYKTYGIIESTDRDAIMVGYNNAEFIVADKMVCGALIPEALTADNIRVMVMSTGFTSLFHQRVSVKGTGSYTVNYGGIIETHTADEIVDIYQGSGYLDMGRVIIKPLNEDDKITILNVEKSYGNPSYRGQIEIAGYEEGLVIINDVPIEEYLYAVVPSEMPVRFGVEALKVQAVCARSYAYKQLLNSSYAKYGAHVDDSVNFQVYNNIEEKADSIQAVKETNGQVAAYQGTPITTYYYSTSCGHTSDISVWGGDASAVPYLGAKEVNPKGTLTDLSDENTFREYINTVNDTDFDYGYGYYRWKIDISMDDLSESINENLYGRYSANKSNIYVKSGDVWISEEIRNIGTLKEIKVLKRTSGGALSEIILVGTKAEILVRNELNIRYLLSPRNNPITLFLGDTTTFYILPSAYCYFDFTDNICHITGGGYGHGIGMSQNAVSNMVKAGMDYEEILKFFYEGSEILNVYE